MSIGYDDGVLDKHGAWHCQRAKARPESGTSVLHVAPISWVATHKKSYQVCHNNSNADRNLLSASFAFHWMLVGFSCVRVSFLQFCFWKIAAHSAHNKQRREQARPWLNCKPGSCRTWNKFEHCLHDQLTRCLRVPTVFRTHSALTLFISFILFSIHSLFRPFVAFGSENSKEVYRLQRRWVGFLLGGRRNMLDILGNNIVYYLVGRGTSNKTVYVLTKWAAKHVKISNWF